ncbi:chorismate mutase family protein [Rhodococcus sp. ABRD24]|uniref:chorismate mutase family protein n=1 Tax=Rhodococcus sp. ABRD24 TaxID=2507582 RepID=UPI00103B8C87|nr:chorismate mutase family protein [Rhodococcus sp. ABRD24]QBJ94606.1 chorismate mutase family protein [Rhodococcus sp. ABRD24]
MDDTNGSTKAGTSGIPTGTISADQPDLEALRAELDGIDRRLLEDIGARIDVCVRIAQVKRDRQIPMMQPHRVNLVQDRAEDFARTHGLSPAFLRRLYDVLIGETCRVEDLVIGRDGAVDVGVPNGDGGKGNGDEINGNGIAG